MENIKTQSGDAQLKFIPYRAFDDLGREWGERDIFEEWEWKESSVVGLINGPRSGGIITIDVDTKQDESGTLTDRFIERFHYMLPDLLDDCYIETTKSGGLHVIYRLEGDCGRKLMPAKTLKAGGRKVALIEILSDGQQTFVYPSKGYKIIGGSLDELPTFNQLHHKQLMELCATFNECPEESQPSSEGNKKELTGKGRAGDIYNERVEPKEVIALMESHGWEVVKEIAGQYFLRRPEKDKGISATFNYDNRKQLIVFSTSTIFNSHNEDGSVCGYTPFQILSKLQFKGEFGKCAKYLDGKGYRDEQVSMWDDLHEAHKAGGDVAMRQKIEPEYIKGLSDNQLEDFWEELKAQFGPRCVNKSYLKNLAKEVSTDTEVDDNSDYTLYEMMCRDYADHFGLNELKGGAVHVIKPIPHICERIERDGTLLTDRIERQLWAYFLDLHRQSFSKDSMKDIIDVLASRNEYHPVRSKLASLKWDKKNRLDTWLIDYCGAKDCVEVRKIGRYFLIGAVARVMQAGCKMDNALVLKSAQQGIGKSQLVQVLSFGYSTDNVGDIGTKDCSEKLQGAWFVELPEMDNLKSASKEKIKRWLSTDNDDEVQKYERRVTARPRQCVFVGTTNEDSLFSEDEFRRFWPVEVNNIDLEGVRRERENLWAEAVELYNNGEKWYSLNPAEFREYGESSREMHPLEDEIRAYAEHHDVIFTKDLHFALYGANSMAKAQFSPSKMREYTPILRRLGFIGNQRHDGKGGAWKRKCFTN